MVVWNQYDGIARPRFMESLASRVLNYFKNNDDSAWLESSSSMIQEIIPAWKGLCADRCKAEDALKDCLHVYQCAENYFLDLNGKKFQGDKVQKVFKNKIITACTHLLLVVLIMSVVVIVILD